VAVSEYSYLFVPFWKTLYAVFAVVGSWVIIQPTALVETFGALAFTRKRGERLGLSSEVTSELVRLSESSDSLAYNLHALRMVGAVFVAVAFAGLLTDSSPAILVSALTVVTVLVITGVFITAKQVGPKHAALLGAAREFVSPRLLVAVLLVEAIAAAAVNTRASLITSVATIICAMALLLLRFLPVSLIGAQVSPEREVDHRLRMARAGLIAIFSQWPPLVLGPISIGAGLSGSVEQIVAISGALCVAVVIWAWGRRLDRDLRRTVADTSQ
jgi:hypothetical protein